MYGNLFGTGREFDACRPSIRILSDDDTVLSGSACQTSSIADPLHGTHSFCEMTCAISSESQRLRSPWHSADAYPFNVVGDRSFWHAANGHDISDLQHGFLSAIDKLQTVAIRHFKTVARQTCPVYMPSVAIIVSFFNPFFTGLRNVIYSDQPTNRVMQ